MELYEASCIFIQSLHDIGLSPHTIASYQTDVKQFVNVVGDVAILEDLTYPVVNDFFLFLHTKNLAHASLKRKRVVIQRFLKFCYQKRLCTQDHSVLIDPMRTKQTNKPKDILNSDEITVIMSYLDNSVESCKDVITARKSEMLYIACRNRLLIYILLYTGCRASEAVSIKKGAVSFQDNTIEILAKGSKYNKIPIHGKLSIAFEQYKKDELYLNNIGFEFQNSMYLFPSKINTKSHISTRTLYDLMMVLSKVIGRNIHAHLFRHTFASYAIASGMNIGTLASIVSHSNPAITLSIYTHEIESRQKQEEMKKLQFEF
ncbi:MAG TPA: tyrosine-type recombinase/integrase [Epulopiscium sp.]|nr:tyrosine-type recombinase/integrase [Candidatus Epulonipiscium sp.]